MIILFLFLTMLKKITRFYYFENIIRSLSNLLNTNIKKIIVFKIISILNLTKLYYRDKY